MESTFWDVLQHQCADYSSDKTEVFSSLKIQISVFAQLCIRDTTFNLTELVEDAWLENPVKPTAVKPSLMLEQLWRPDFTLTWYQNY